MQMLVFGKISASGILMDGEWGVPSYTSSLSDPCIYTVVVVSVYFGGSTDSSKLRHETAPMLTLFPSNSAV